LQKLEENLNNLEGKAKSRDQLYRSQQEKVSELEGQIASKTELCRQLEKQLFQLSGGVQRKEEICLNLQQKVACQMYCVYFIYFPFVIATKNMSSDILIWLPFCQR
jgi:uncharacterized protein (DUF3084 family)